MIKNVAWCKVCGQAFTYEDSRIDGERLMLDFYSRKKHLCTAEEEDRAKRMALIKRYEKEHDVCELCIEEEDSRATAGRA